MSPRFRVVWQDNELVQQVNKKEGFFGNLEWSFQINLPILSIGGRKDTTEKPLPLQDGKELQDALDKQIPTEKTPRGFHDLISKLENAGEDPKNLIVMVQGILRPICNLKKIWQIFISSNVLKKLGEELLPKDIAIQNAKDLDQIILPRLQDINKEKLMREIYSKEPFSKSSLQDISGVSKFVRCCLQSLTNTTSCNVYMPPETMKVLPIGKQCKVTGIICYDAQYMEDIIRAVVIAVRE